MERTEEFIERARALWDEGLSVKEIGRQLGVSKNVISGIAFRKGFASRVSPIKAAAELVAGRRRAKAEAAREARAAGYGKPKPPQKPKPRPRPVAPAGKGFEPPPVHLPLLVTPQPRPRVVVAQDGLLGRLAAAELPGPRGCHWPLWRDSEPATHRYCCAPVSRRLYCAAHDAAAWREPVAVAA